MSVIGFIIAFILGGILAVVLVVVLKKSEKNEETQFSDDVTESTRVLTGNSETVVLDTNDHLSLEYEGRDTLTEDGETETGETEVIEDTGKKIRLTGTIKILSGELEGAEIEIHDGESLVIGRDPEKCNILFDEPYISRVHCVIRYEFDFSCGAVFYVLDKSSTGTFLQNESAKGKVTIHRLNMNDEVRAQLNDVVVLGEDGEKIKLTY